MTFNKILLITMGLIAVLISATCEILLFIDYASTPLDKLIAGGSAFVLVICQFAFVSQVIKHWANNKLFSLFIASIIFVLFALSVSGTSAFFESRFSTQNQNLTQTSTGYMLKMELINDLKNQQTKLMQSAKTEKEKGNGWYSGEQLKEASAITKNRQSLIETLENSAIENNTAGNALAVALGAGRWGLWFAMAILIDLCPLICFALISENAKAKNEKRKPKHQSFDEFGLPQIMNTPDMPKIKTEKHEITDTDILNDPDYRKLTEKYKTEKDNYSELEKHGRKPFHIQKNTQKPTPATQNETRLKSRLENYLKDNNMNQTQFCEKYDIKQKHLSLAKNHNERANQGKETAPKAVITKIKSIVSAEV